MFLLAARWRLLDSEPNTVLFTFAVLYEWLWAYWGWVKSGGSVRAERVDNVCPYRESEAPCFPHLGI